MSDSLTPASAKLIATIAARRQSQSLSQPAPLDAVEALSEVEGWMERAAAAETLDARLFYLSQALTYAPGHPIACQWMYESLWRLLHEDAFLGYLGEDDRRYDVQTGAGLAVAVSKNRAVPLVYPPLTPSPLQPALRWLWWAFLGLLPAGLGTLLCAPVAAVVALRVPQPLSQADRTRRRVVLWSAALAWCGAFLLFLFLLVHL